MKAYGQSQTPPETLTEQEARGILNCLQKSPHGTRARAMILLMYRCGLRKGEILNLHPSRIAYLGVEPMIQIRKSKFGKGRDVPIDKRIIEDLKAWDAIRPHGAYYFCTLKQNKANGISKGNPIGSQLSHGMINTTIAEAAKRAGIERKVWPHMFRHTCATNWLREGIPLEHIRVLLGHSSILITQRYLHAAPGEIAKGIYALGEEHDPTPEPEKPIIPLKQLIEEREIECSWCAEMIKAKAKKCRYCGSPVTQDIPVVPKAEPRTGDGIIERVNVDWRGIA